jgi:hypothetical protein
MEFLAEIDLAGSRDRDGKRRGLAPNNADHLGQCGAQDYSHLGPCEVVPREVKEAESVLDNRTTLQVIMTNAGICGEYRPSPYRNGRYPHKIFSTPLEMICVFLVADSSSFERGVQVAIAAMIFIKKEDDRL